MDEIIEEGNHVVIMRNFDTENMKIIPVIRNTVVHYGKLHFNPSPLIGSKFGSVFAIKDEQMIKVDDFEQFDQDLSNTVTNNMLTTFNDKSEFSKEKIIKKRKRKSHSYVVTAMKPNLLLINELLYAREKIGGLRCDSLSQIMTLSNIQNGTKCLLLDHNSGLLTGAVMTRILPLGTCIQLFSDIEACYTIRKNLEMFNITDKISENRIFAITIKDVYKIYLDEDSFENDITILKAKDEEKIAKISSKVKADQLVDGKEQTEIMEVETGNKLNNIQEEIIQSLRKRNTNRDLRNAERLKASSYLKSKSLDSIIMIVQNDHPLEIFKVIYTFLAPSRQFVIYSDTIEPLLECHHYLRTSQLAVLLNISESWLRRYQVLPDRTRPQMNVTGYGGFILSGTKAIFSTPTTLSTSTDIQMSSEEQLNQTNS